MRMLHTDRGLPMKSNRTLFRSGSANCFTGADLVLWLIIDLGIQSKVEALHLATMISHLGYIYPVDRTHLGQSIKDDGTLYRLQTTKYWPSQIVGDMEFKYGVFLVRKLLHKGKLKIQDYELDTIERMKEDVLKQYWHRVVTAAKEEYGVLRQQKKSTRATMESQEAAFWFCQKPPPPLSPATDCMLSRIAMPLTLHCEQVDSYEDTMRSEVTFLEENLLKHRANMSTALKSMKNNCKQYMEYDPIITPPFPSNPWVTGSTLLWSYKASFVENANSTRVRQWGYSLDELLSDKGGRKVFEEFCNKQCCAENIRFWTACDNLHSTRLSMVPVEVYNIYSEFLAEGCLSEINVSAEIKKECMEDMKTPSRYAFTSAKNQVYFLMKEDIYPRFVKSDFYKKLLKPRVEDSGLLAFGRGLFSRLRRSRYGHPHRNSSVPDTSSPFRAIDKNLTPFGGHLKPSASLDSLQVLGASAGDADLFIQSLMKPCNNVSPARKISGSRKDSKMSLQDGPRRRVSAPAPPILVHHTDGTTAVLESTVEEMDSKTTGSGALPVSPLVKSSFQYPGESSKIRMMSSSLDSLIVVDSGTLKRRAKQYAELNQQLKSDSDLDISKLGREDNSEPREQQLQAKDNENTLIPDPTRLSPNISPQLHSSSSTSSLSTCSASSVPVESSHRARSVSFYQNSRIEQMTSSTSNLTGLVDPNLKSHVEGYGSHQSL
ncbi:regulator of G-protein signaling 7-like isoform X2 [Dysidea avara]